jgi:outer membrane receptor protein involved in Fe transport
MRLTSKHSIPLLFLSFLAVSDVGAEERELLVSEISNELKKYTEVATLTKQNELYQPYIISVFQGKELERLGINNLKEALELVPGVDMATDNIDGKTPIFRGSNPFAYGQSKLLIDGIVVNDLLYDGYTSFLYMPVNVIKRIEVVRGPGSKTDGINAYAGSINIITYAEQFEGMESRDSIFAKAGSYDYIMGGFVKTFRADELTLFTDFYYQKDDKKLPAGPDSAATGVFYNFPNQLVPTTYPIDNTALARSGDAPLWKENFSLGVRLDYKDVYLTARTLYHKQGSAYGLNYLLPEDEDYIKSPTHYLELGYDKAIGKYEVVIKAGVKFDDFSSHSKLAPDGLVFPTLSDPLDTSVEFDNGFYGVHEARQRTFYQSSYLKYRGFDDHYLSFGYRISKEETYDVVTKTTDRDTGTGLTDYSETLPFFDEDAQRETLILSVQDQYDYSDALSFMYGVNFEHNSQCSAQFDPRVSMVYQVDAENILKAIYSKSHRNPSWQELYTLNNIARVGNPELEPERVDAVEAAYIRKFTSESYLQANVFYLVNKEQINKANPKNEYRNEMDTEIYGFEVEFRGNITRDDKLYANYSYVDGKDDKGNPLANVAKHMAKGYYTYDLSNYSSASTIVKYVGTKERVSGDSRDKLDDYLTVDATVCYENPLYDFSLTLSVRNIFDASVKYPSQPYTYQEDYPQEGRNFLVAFSKEF